MCADIAPAPLGRWTKLAAGSGSGLVRRASNSGQSLPAPSSPCLGWTRRIRAMAAGILGVCPTGWAAVLHVSPTQPPRAFGRDGRQIRADTLVTGMCRRVPSDNTTAPGDVGQRQRTEWPAIRAVYLADARHGINTVLQKRREVVLSTAWTRPSPFSSSGKQPPLPGDGLPIRSRPVRSRQIRGRLTAITAGTNYQ